MSDQKINTWCCQTIRHRGRKMTLVSVGRSKYAAVVATAVMALALASCSQTSGPNETNGAVLGAVAGGIIGSSIGGSAGNQIVGALAGAAIGSMIGAGIGSSLDEEDRAQFVAMMQETASTGAPRRYYSRKSGVRITTRVAATTKSDAVACRSIEAVAIL